jgi:hypothetical protein
MQEAKYSDKVFINCPFDDPYQPMLYAAVFAIYRCGFLPVIALSDDNATELRLDKIYRAIASCKYGFHDISRTESNAKGLPRFNMPLEFGIFLGAKHFGNEENVEKNAIVFDVKEHRYLEFISDINGIDIKSHEGNPSILIEKIRNWLKSASSRTTIIGDAALISEYEKFNKKLPRIAKKLGLKGNKIPFNDYCSIVESSINSIFTIQRGS